MAQEKVTAKKISLSNTNDTLTNALLAAVAPFSYLAHLPLLPFVRAYQFRFGRMPTFA